MQKTKSSPALFLIGITPSHTVLGNKACVQGIELQSTSLKDVQAWFVQIDASDFQGSKGQANLQNIDWLSPRILAHQQAIDVLMARGPCFPAGFGSLFSSIETLTDTLHRHRDILLEYFSYVGTRREWCLKLYSSRANSPDENSTTMPVPKSGSNYLAEKRRQKLLKDQKPIFVHDLCRKMQNEIQQMGFPIIQRPLLSIHQNDSDRPLYANFALLLDEAQIEQARACADSVSSEGPIQTQIELSGPLAPYSFCPSLASQTTGAA